MTATAVASPAVPTWREVLPAGRDYVALPSAGRPRVVAEHDRGVLAYVRSALLAAPPGSAVPGWAFGLARTVLAAPPAWRAAPHLPRTARADPPAPDRDDGALRNWLVRDGRRMAVLEHSNDGDGRYTLLLFTPGATRPDVVVKVAGGVRVGRLDTEAVRLRDLGRLPLDGLRATVPAVLGPPATHLPSTLAVTGLPGVPMLVRYHRGSRSARPGAVRVDFAAAAAWLRRFGDATAAAADTTVRLDLPAHVAAAAVDRLHLVPDIAGDVLADVLALRERLRRHRVRRAWTHGDFWPGNVLTDRRGTVTGVVDWEASTPAGNPLRDVTRFFLGHATYLDRHTGAGRPVRGHPGLRADHGLAGLHYALDGAGWYPTLARRFLDDGLARLGVPPAAARPAVLAEVLAVAAEATDDGFCRTHLRAFHALSRSAV